MATPANDTTASSGTVGAAGSVWVRISAFTKLPGLSRRASLGTCTSTWNVRLARSTDGFTLATVPGKISPEWDSTRSRTGCPTATPPLWRSGTVTRSLSGRSTTSRNGATVDPGPVWTYSPSETSRRVTTYSGVARSPPVAPGTQTRVSLSCWSAVSSAAWWSRAVARTVLASSRAWLYSARATWRSRSIASRSVAETIPLETPARVRSFWAVASLCLATALTTLGRAARSSFPSGRAVRPSLASSSCRDRCASATLNL